MIQKKSVISVMRSRHILLMSPVLGLVTGQTSLTFVKRWTDLVPESEGTCDSAVGVMAFHRDKMNEYLCKQFLAEEIVAAKNGQGPESRSDVGDLMEDDGSEGYRDWLARSTTLEDIYKHYEQSTAEDAPVGASLPPGQFDGDVTGYAMVGNNKVAPGSTGYGVGTSYGVPQYGAVKAGGSDKGMKLNDLFQLALTAIAFMAFGTFLCEVIMCIMGVETKEKQTQVMVVGDPDELHANKYFKNGESTFTAEEPSVSRMRQRRSLLENVNRMAGYASATLDGVENLYKDGGQQLQQALCEANRYSRGVEGRRRIWLPLWSFGVSWIGGKQVAEASHSHFAPLKFLTATVQGWAGMNCTNIAW